MKKYIAILLIFVILISFSACSQEKKIANDNNIKVSESAPHDTKGGIIVKNSDNSFWDEFDEVQNQHYTFAREDAPESRESRKYKESLMSGGYFNDIYIDNTGAEYYYTSDGKAYRYSNLDGVNDYADKIALSNPEKILTEAQSIEIVKEFCKNNLDISFDNYEQLFIKRTDSGACEFAYKVKCGKDGYISMGTFTATVNALGEIKECGLSNPTMLKDFDKKTVSHIAQSDIEKAVLQQLETVYSDKMLSHEIKSTSVIKYDDEYMIFVLCDIETQKDGTNTTFAHRMMIDIT